MATTASKTKKTASKKKITRRIRIKRSDVKKAVKGARKRVGKIASKARTRIKSVTRDSTRKRAAQLTLSVIELQKAGFDNVIDIIGKLQEQTGKTLHKTVEGISWVPGEGKQVVDEWIKTVKRGRQDFKRTTDQSFDLMAKFVRRIERGQTAKKPAAKKRPAKKKSTRKAGPKKAAAKRTARKRS